MVQAVIILLLCRNYSVKKLSLQTLKMRRHLPTSHLFMKEGRILVLKFHQCYIRNLFILLL